MTIQLQGLVILATQIISEPFFDTLRTKEQLGYIVQARRLAAHGAIVRS